MDQHCTGNTMLQVIPYTGNTLYNVGPYISSQNCRLFFCAKMFVDCGSSLIIASVILMCNVGSDRSKQNFIAYFPTKTCLCALGQHCTSNFSINFSISNCTSQHWLGNIPMQCCPSMVNATLHRLFPHKRCLLAMGKHWAGKNLVQCCPRSSWQRCTAKKSWSMLS